MVQDRRALDVTALSLMVLLTALWGFQQVAIKTIAADVSPVMQAAIRSILASVLLLAWAPANSSLFTPAWSTLTHRAW
jgi:drug/metabolite transporter (DMT)-like permease